MARYTGPKSRIARRFKEPIFGPDRKGDIKHSNADISKAKEMLGYDPSWSFDRGIWFIHWKLSE